MIEDDVSMVNKIMNLLAERFCSKAPPAASLPPGRLANLRRNGFDSVRTSYRDTVFVGRGEGRFDSQPR
jgi:hypothetical protein